jgi:8-oxo-dGTP pyrophosphatase MutT (NUDIX family)
VKRLGESSTKEKILLEACKMGAARELFEETGIDVRGQLERLEPAAILTSSTGNKLDCMLKDKCYFQLNVNDKDFFLAVSTLLSNDNIFISAFKNE